MKDGHRLREAARALVEAERDGRKARDLERLEQRTARALRNHWREQRKLLMRRMDSVRVHFTESAGSDFDRIWNAVEDSTQGPLTDTLADVMGEAAQRGAASSATDLGVSITFDRYDPVSAGRIRDTAAQRVAQVDQTTRQQIGRIVTTGLQDGQSWTQVATNIEDRFTSFRDPTGIRHLRSRAELVAVTEMGEAYELGRDEQARTVRDAGVDVEKRWITAVDERVCDECGPNGMDGWLDHDEPFSSGVARPLAHPGCRCDEQLRAA